MPNFTYTLSTPDAPNDPSEDQPVMKINNDSNDSIWSAGDHFGFNNNKGGRHKQVTLTVEASPPLVEGDMILYTDLNSTQKVLFNKTSFSDLPLFSGLGLNGSAKGLSSMYGGVVVQWGIVAGTFTPGQTGVESFTLGFPIRRNGVFTQLLFNSAAPATNPSAMAEIIIDVNPAVDNQPQLNFHWKYLSDQLSNKYSGFFYIAIGI